jgi:hypothetical protein
MGLASGSCPSLTTSPLDEVRCALLERGGCGDTECTLCSGQSGEDEGRSSGSSNEVHVCGITLKKGGEEEEGAEVGAECMGMREKGEERSVYTTRRENTI